MRVECRVSKLAEKGCRRRMAKCWLNDIPEPLLHYLSDALREVRVELDLNAALGCRRRRRGRRSRGVGGRRRLLLFGDGVCRDFDGSSVRLGGLLLRIGRSSSRSSGGLLGRGLLSRCFWRPLFGGRGFRYRSLLDSRGDSLGGGRSLLRGWDISGDGAGGAGLRRDFGLHFFKLGGFRGRMSLLTNSLPVSSREGTSRRACRGRGPNKRSTEVVGERGKRGKKGSVERKSGC